MKIDKLWLDGFKNLRDFRIDFDEQSLTSVIVGRNGSGKSNLLEALIIIFRDLDLGKPPVFKYQLDYVCRNYRVHIDADPERLGSTLKISVDNEGISFNDFLKTEQEDEHGQFVKSYLPKYVFGYYSGPSNRMEIHFEEHQERFYRSLLHGEDRPLRPLLYARLVHSQFVLLAFFTEKDQTILEFLKEHLKIEGLDSTLFVMRQPPWKSTEGDPRFWYARGSVRKFLSKLYELALVPLRLKQRVQFEFRSFKTLEHLYLYLKDVHQLRELVSIYENQQEFFKALESTYISRLISEVRIRVKIRNMDGSLTFRELSEGEQQLLMVLGLLRFTKEEESLFLLDEPDTHLNPSWGMQYIQFLKDLVGDQDSSHIIMTTHDPLVIAGLERSQVHIMQRDQETDRITVNPPEKSPRGMGVAALLTSDIYGLRSQLDPYTLELLDEKRALAIKPHLTDKDKKRLDELNEELEDLDFTKTVRDPLYKPFVDAMTKLEKKHELQAPVLTKEQQQTRQRLAQVILQKLKKKEGEEGE